MVTCFSDLVCGHHTIEACYVSQFKQHLPAVLGLPLGASMKVPAAIMYNLLGEEEGEEGFSIAHQLMRKAVSVSGASVHWYEKPGRLEVISNIYRLLFYVFLPSPRSVGFT